ncbi:hypothetical protein KA037_02240 [Patescibacteria group bacterium]|nr:hypothetical protein [Patescibacteria group bacterium]MBP7841478.1 hypothetical protein [Patescibacteria group bacterium]
MKKYLITIASILICGYTIADYTPTTQDKTQVSTLQKTLDNIIGSNNKDLRSYLDQIDMLRSRFAVNTKIGYMLQELYEHLRVKLDLQKDAAKLTSYKHKVDFLNQYSGDIIKTINEPDRCTRQYQLVDDLSFVYNQPTSVTLATRYRETTCRWYLPGNGDGPFQIVKNDYGSGDLTLPIFKQTLIDYLEFAQNKFNRFEKANSKSGLIIGLSYTGLNFTGIVRHGALYNSLSGKTVYGEIQPARPNYVFDGYGEAYSGSKRYGLMPKTLILLDRELKNDPVYNIKPF